MNIKKLLLIVLVMVLLLITGCQKKAANTNQSSEKIDDGQILAISAEIMNSVPEEIKSEMEEMFREYNEADAEAKKLTALMLSTDVSLGQLGMINEQMLLQMAGNALQAYPEHPLVINNAASVLFDAENTEKAILLYEQALNVVPDNPIFLTNLANAYIQKGDFASAEKYAKESLVADPEYTAAYQVLTVCHLEKGEDLLAVETLIKSTKNCFNYVSIAQFSSLLQELQSLDVEDEFPIREDLIDELYTLAKQDAEYVYMGMDTPDGQIKLKPFPAIATLADFVAKGDSFVREENKFSAKFDEAMQKRFEASADDILAVHNYIEGSIAKIEGVYPARESLKQIFAFKILTAFYEHKYKQAYHAFKERSDLEYEDYTKKRELIMSVLSDKAETSDDGVAILYGYSGSLDELVDLSNIYFKDFYSNQTDYYNEVKQITEEYWLKSNGMLKYVSHEPTFNDLLAERDILVYSELLATVGGLGLKAWMFEFEIEMSVAAKELLGLDKLQDGGASSAELYMQPDAEYPPLPMFKEANDKPKELNLGWVSASVSRNQSIIKLTTPISSHSKIFNNYDGRETTTTAFGANPAIGAFAKLLLGDKYKSLQETIWKKYNIGLPNDPHMGKSGQYITRDSGGRIVDKGTIRIQSASVGIPGVKGASIDIERQVMQSYVTGVTEVERSKSIGFSNLKLSR